MLRVLWRLPLYALMRQFGWPRMLPLNLTITLSPNCNSRCRTCNIWRQSADELRLDEWERIFQSLGHAPYWVTISGGEPFLQDLPALVALLYRHCKPAIINIPSNALLTERIASQVAEVCAAAPGAQVIVNLSLDGVGEQHDQIRGVPGNYARFLQTYASLRALNCKNLTIGIHSVISTNNVESSAELFDAALALQPDSYITEIAEQRAELDTLGQAITPTAAAYARAMGELGARTAGRKLRGVAGLAAAMREQYYQLVVRILEENRQVTPCYAGVASGQIYADGQVWACCVRGENLLNLREVGYDFGRAWFSSQALAMRKSIASGECACPLANASYTSLLMHPPTLARIAWRLARNALKN